MIFGRHGKRYNMSKKAANDTLKNVLAACNIESEKINFDLLIVKGFAQTNYVDACKWIAIGFLFLVLISPLALINNEIKIESNSILNQDRIIIEDHMLFDDHFTLKLVGEDIDYDAIFAENTSGSVILPIDMDESAGFVTFPYDNEALTVHLSDMHGHSVNVSLSGTQNKK